MIVTQHPKKIVYKRNKIIKGGRSSPWYIIEEVLQGLPAFVLYLGDSINRVYYKSDITDPAQQEILFSRWKKDMDYFGHYEWREPNGNNARKAQKETGRTAKDSE